MFLAELPRAPKAPAGGASITIEYGEPIEPRKFGYDVMSVRPYVRPYARIRPGDEFAGNTFVFKYTKQKILSLSFIWTQKHIGSIRFV